MSESTPENPQNSEPHGADPLEPSSPTIGSEATPDGSADSAAATSTASDPDPDSRADRGAAADSISAESIVNAPPTTELDATDDEATEKPEPTVSPEAAAEAEATEKPEPTVQAEPMPRPEDTYLASEPGQFRTKPMDPNLPFSDYGQPSGQNQFGHNPTRQHPSQQYSAPRSYPHAGAPPQRPHGYPQPGGYQQVGPNGTRQVNPQAAPHANSHPTHPQGFNSGPGFNSPGPAPAPGPVPNQAPGPIPNQAPNPGMPMTMARPPRRKKPRPEPVTFAPVTGTMPLSRSEVTEIPADGPIEWPRRSTGIIGVANLVLSAVLAVIWAWIPLGLLFTGIGGIFALGLGVLALVVWVIVQQGANVFERYRAELIYGDKIPVPKIESSTRASGFTRFLHNRWLQVKSGSFWRSTAHHYIKMLLGAIIVGGAIVGICGSIFGVFGAINPQGVNTFFLGIEPVGGTGRIGVAIGALIVLASSIAILWFAPYLDRALDRALLPPARTVALQAEVTELDRARKAGIEAAAAERLRIERDLHDGAQPRLVALTMTLGMAKTKIDNDPERAKELVSEAHAEAKGIVTELRQLARGIHPAVLTDRGLDAAVSALAGRSSIPVEVDVRLEGRIAREAEAVAYFVVAECLTNITKHSGATHARVFVAPIETGVQIVVSDNGHGGARVDRSGRHTGIAGLIDRVEAARGTLNLTSPAGGPTTIVVEVPCAS